MTVSPDEGMMLLQQRMHRQDIAAPEAASPAAGAEVGGELAIMVRLAAALESNAAAIRASAAPTQIAWEKCHPIPLHPLAQSAAGTLDDERWQPRQGWAWQIMGMAFTLGAGGTSYSVWEDSPNDPTNLQFSATVSGRWEPNDFFILPGSRLVFTSVGGGLTVCKGKAVEIALDSLPGYLGLKIAGKLF